MITFMKSNYLCWRLANYHANRSVYNYPTKVHLLHKFIKCFIHAAFIFQMTSADVKQQINVALDQLVSPLRVKEHLVAQLKTQVADLERFISYLQADTKNIKCACGCAYHSLKQPFQSETTLGLIQKTATVLQMFAALQLGCGPQQFKKNDLKTSMKVNHWGWVLDC